MLKLPPLVTNDYSSVVIRSQLQNLTPCFTVKKCKVTSSIKRQLTLDLAREHFTLRYQAESVDSKVSALHSILDRIYNQQCPWWCGHQQGDLQLHTPLTIMLKRAKQRWYNDKKAPTKTPWTDWEKHQSSFLKQQAAVEKRMQTE